LAIKNLGICIIAVLILSSCSVGSLLTNKSETPSKEVSKFNINPEEVDSKSGSIFDLLSNEGSSETILKVNRYIWKASLEVLSFLPLEGVDPFSGIITTGWGKPPGASTEYRATVYIQDPSLDARTLKVVLLKRSGPADPKTIKTIENAILSRARQLRISDDKL
jgi:hypothetical protein